MNPKPLSWSELLTMIVNGIPIPSDRVLAMFADKDNWVQVYDCKTTGDYKPHPCEWAFIGPIRPPYELAQLGLKHHEICPGCHNEIDPEVCWCGEYIDDHHTIEHPRIPMGCRCGES